MLRLAGHGKVLVVLFEWADVLLFQPQMRYQSIYSRNLHVDRYSRLDIVTGTSFPNLRSVMHGEHFIRRQLD